MSILFRLAPQLFHPIPRPSWTPDPLLLLNLEYLTSPFQLLGCSWKVGRVRKTMAGGNPSTVLLFPSAGYADLGAILLHRAIPYGYLCAASATLVPELERLADSRQTQFEGEPAKHGSNLHEFITEDEEVANAGRSLRHMYHYSKEVLEMLY
jgi:hypothetical protein